MQNTIAIIDRDICFTSLLISRLKKQLPGFLAFPVSSEVLMSVPDLLLDSRFILYNQYEISEQEVLSHCTNEEPPILVPLLSEQPPYPPKDVFMLVHEVESRAGLGRIPPSEHSSVQTCIALSFVSPKERESHVVRLIRSSRSTFNHIVRLDIMPGISMPEDPPSWTQSGGTRSSGISELLAHIRMKRVAPIQISSFLEPDPYGDLRFGKPVNSDDVIMCHSKTLSHLISRTVSYLSQEDGPSLLFTVCEGISFMRMRTLCKQFSHMEILTPLHMEKDIMLCNEIDRLQKAHYGTSHIDYPLSLPKPGYEKETEHSGSHLIMAGRAV